MLVRENDCFLSFPVISRPVVLAFKFRHKYYRFKRLPFDLCSVNEANTGPAQRMVFLGLELDSVGQTTKTSDKRSELNIMVPGRALIGPPSR